MNKLQERRDGRKEATKLTIDKERQQKERKKKREGGGGGAGQQKSYKYVKKLDLFTYA
jgi:hypothetical protein